MKIDELEILVEAHLKMFVLLQLSLPWRQEEVRRMWIIRFHKY